MARPKHKLSSAELKAKAPGKYSDGGGLWFHKRPDGGAQWFLRYTLFGRRHEMGLGSFPAVSLKAARQAAEKWQAVVRVGKDAIKERGRQSREAQRNLNILADIAKDAFESRKAELKGDGKAGRWFSPLELHVLPKLGKMPVSQIDQRDIRDTLAPIWHTKADTARKAMNRLSICMRHAAALGLDVDLQATEKAKALLGKQRHKVTNIPAMPWKDVPAFYQSLDGGTTAELALRLLILTAVRSYPLRYLHLDQIDGDIWTIPAEAMKGRKGATSDFRVPLSKEAQSVIAEATPFARDGFLFPGVRKGVISDMTMSKLMERRGMVERPHGFRSSFRDWVAEATNTPHDIAETALGHVVGGAVERSYRRTDFLEQRKTLMDRWARQQLAKADQKIVQL
ncbi:MULTISPECIES: tyrosine-type recombinase/integrase [Ruegeria]|uniref:Integrase arm-type DNA-binding domain-containing protein n=1 Tax=Ruegeria atlantica TaxID=81569 RepID=A0ABX1WBI1_9RHOB|nr:MULTISPECIES: site-specific integrase [Ruegeria]NOC85182.1 integrase arm-type DNA-binding domain-containing protein [Ruegeria sp. HKCCD6428]NOC91950.1 integrase arm-type DNA-binding domain-containing protein [Ruegeria sp. HKCCD6604]NOD30634.1 integrase arm-type DNA-binding domain-containing protein [Ruegeria atlantica]